MKILLALSIVAMAVLAEEAKAPEISMQQQLDYRRAQVKLLEAQSEYQAVVTGMQQTCGELQVITDAKGDPVCGKK